MKKARFLCLKLDFGFIIALCAILWTPFCIAGIYEQDQEVEHYKMLSTVEYSGQGQFKHQVETTLTVEKDYLSQDKVRYSVSSKDFDLSGIDTNTDRDSHELSFIIDEKSKRISSGGRDLTLLEKVHNYCQNSLQKVTKENIGKTWKQTFDLSSFDYSLPKKLTFTLTAIEENTDTYGKMIAVRALSEPFVIKVVKAQEGMKDVKSRIRAAYLFDSEIEDIYLSISVFEATGDIESSNEKLRHEVATYKTDSKGVAVNMNGLSKDFEKFIRKVGLSSKDTEVVKETPLPRWARSEGLRAAQVGNICAASSCEGAINPVVTVCLPVARTVALQSYSTIVSAGQIGSIGTILAKSIPAMQGMKIAMAPAWAGYGIGTAAHVTGLAGATAGGIAIAENNSNGGGKSRSPVTP
ncbi:MAG: hypothetical protein JW715_14800 [Sedimentisphaerales bacterium]|nr:hypothetical protein [Sedimentisphaerales bacterium]